MPQFAVDGMRIALEHRLRGVPEAPGDPDWRIEMERGPPDEVPAEVEWTGDVREADERWARFGRTADAHVVLLEGVASLLAVRRDRLAWIRHDLGPALDGAVLRRVSPYLASLLGRLVLHAAAVLFPAGGVLLLGGPGAGKSTTALALDAAGVPVLADDHVSVDAPAEGAAVAHASFPFATIDAEAAAAFRSVRDAERHGAEKWALPFVTSARPAVAALCATAFLVRGSGVSLTPMRGPEAAARLLREAVFVADPADDEAQALRLDACVNLVGAAPPATLVLPTGLDRLKAALPAVAALFGGPQA